MNDQTTFVRAERPGRSAEHGKLRTVDYREVFRILRRRATAIFGMFAFIMVVAVVILYQITPLYTAEALVVIDTRKTQVVDFQAVMSGLSADASVIRSELQILKSPSLLSKVVQKLDLTAAPGFMLGGESWFTRWGPASWLPEDWRQPLGLGNSSGNAEISLEQRKIQYAAQVLGRRLSVVNDGRSYVIHISTDDPDPKLAANIVNTVADLYLVQQLESKFEATRLANNWLSDRIEELRQKVRKSDQAVELYRAQHNLDQTKGETISSQQLAELNSQLVLARAELAQREARLRQVQDAVRTGGVADSSDVLNSQLIQRLREQETDLIRQQADLSTKYGPEHPQMINIRAQIKDLDRKIGDEMKKIVASVAGDAEVARARVAALQQSLDQLQKRNSQTNLAEVQLHELEREAAANQTLYQNFLSRFKEVTSQENFQQADARVISPASVPISPSYPRKGLSLSVIFIFSLGAGVGLAFLLERVDAGFRSPQQIDALLGIRGLGIIPALNSFKPDSYAPSEEVLKRPMSAFSEAIRTIRTSILLSGDHSPPKTILVTSAVPNEGKTSFSISLARSAAISNQRVLLVDCDMRRPSVAKMLNDEAADDILRIFGGDTNLEQLIQIDESSGMHYIRSKSGTTNPPDLFASQAFRAFLGAARERYDLVILDAPPVLAVSDALVLSRMVDATVFLVRWAKTPRQVTVGALKLFDNVQGRIAGVVLSRVNVRRHSLYGYGDYGYYYGRYQQYYRLY